jgi:hypothetical protein
MFTRNGIFPGTVLVDGFVVGMWRLARSRGAATLIIEMFETASEGDRDAIVTEGEHLLAFAAPDAPARDIRFAALV